MGEGSEAVPLRKDPAVAVARPGGGERRLIG
jgi:hypothetical protein